MRGHARRVTLRASRPRASFSAAVLAAQLPVAALPLQLLAAPAAAALGLAEEHTYTYASGPLPRGNDVMLARGAAAARTGGASADCAR